MDPRAPSVCLLPAHSVPLGMCPPLLGDLSGHGPCSGRLTWTLTHLSAPDHWPDRRCSFHWHSCLFSVYTGKEKTCPAPGKWARGFQKHRRASHRHCWCSKDRCEQHWASPSHLGRTWCSPATVENKIGNISELALPLSLSNTQGLQPRELNSLGIFASARPAHELASIRWDIMMKPLQVMVRHSQVWEPLALKLEVKMSVP
jgi:hypothetical protein